jgi:hypothetical protein
VAGDCRTNAALRRLRRARGLAALGAIVWLTPFLNAQTGADIGIRFFSDGGVYCFRLAPEGTNLSEETSWTLMMLTGVANKKNTCRIRSFDAGPMHIGRQDLNRIGLSVVEAWRRESLREEFFERFAKGIEAGVLRARVVTLTPPRLATMSEMDRAEEYLKFSDRGSRVDFEKVPNLSTNQFLTFQTYNPD